MEERIKAMKKYVGTGEGSRTMLGLSAAFVAVAAVLTAAGLAIGFSPRRLVLLGVLWIVALGMTGFSALTAVRNRRDTEKNAAALTNMEEVLKEFESAPKFPGDELRMGETYIFARKSGGVIAYDEIRSAGLRRVPLQQTTFMQYYVILAGGKERVIFQCEEKDLNRKLIEGITFNIAARSKGAVKFT